MERYAGNLIYDENSLEFTFTIKGKKGVERKKVKLTKTQYLGAYNLALGTIKDNDSTDYSDITNTGDLVNLFGKVVNCVVIFLEKHPGKSVFFTGDTEQKTLVYHEILRRHYNEFSKKFYIFGIVENEYKVVIEKFDSNSKYSGFLIESKLKTV